MVLCVITFSCKWFLTFQRLILKFSKKVQSSGVPHFGVLSPGSWAFRLESHVLCLMAQVLGPGPWVPSLGTYVPGLVSRVLILAPAFWVLGPYSRLCRSKQIVLLSRFYYFTFYIYNLRIARLQQKVIFKQVIFTEKNNPPDTCLRISI